MGPIELHLDIKIGDEHIYPVHHDHRRPHLRWTIGPVSEQRLTGPVEKTLMLQLKDTQQAVLGIAPVDKKGNAAAVQDGSVVWTTSDSNVLAVTPSADGLSATVVAGNPGVAQVNVSADADMGDGVTPITGTLDVTVVAGDAVSLSVSAGVPTEQP